MSERACCGWNNMWGALPLRVAVGAVFIHAGAPKLFGDHAKIFEMVKGLGFPSPELFGWLLMIAEFVGGIALIAGVLTRLAAFGNFFDMLVAIFLVHWNGGFAGIQFQLTLAAASAALVLMGAGPLSVDDWLLKVWRRRRAAKTIAQPPPQM